MDGLWVLVLIGAVVAVIVLIVRTNGINTRLRNIETNALRLGASLSSLEQLYAALLASRHGAQPAAAPAAPSPSPQSIVPETQNIEPAPQDVEPEPVQVEAFAAAPQPGSVAEPVAAFVPPPPDPAPVAAPAPGAPVPPQPWTQAPAESAPPAPPAQPGSPNWERLIGVNLPVWLGAIALSIGGFFFAGWAIETGFFSPVFRVLAALVLALLLLAGAEIVRRRVKRDNGPAIASALASAAVATLFGTAYLASVTYELIPIWAGFVAMALVTLIGIAIALVYGQIVAVVGLVGGYVAPLLLASGPPSAPLFFSYLTAILIAMFAVIRVRDWWQISLVALAGPALWILFWTVSVDLSDQPFWIAAFTFAVPAIVAVAASNAWTGNGTAVTFFDASPQFTTARQAVAFAFAIASVGFLVLLQQSYFAVALWQAQVAFAVATVALAIVWHSSMRFVPFLPLAASMLVLIAWPGGNVTPYAYATAALAATFLVWSLDQMRRLREPAIWSATITVIAVFFFLVALLGIAGWQSVLDNRHLWALAALVLAALMLGLLRLFGPKVEDAAKRNPTYAAFAAGATAFLSLVAVIELDPVLYPVAAALQVLGLAAIHTRAPLRGLRVVAAVLTSIYVLLILGAWSGNAELSFSPMRFAFARSLDEAPFVLLILPGLAFLGAATLFRRTVNTTDVLPNGLEIASVAMLALGILYQMVPGIADVPFEDAHIAAAWLLTPELILAALAVWTGRTFVRRPLYISGIVLAVAIAAGMVLGLLLPILSLWPAANIPGPTLFNVALLSLGLPSLLLLGLGWFIRKDPVIGIRNTGIGTSIAAVFLLFGLMLLEIRHAFHPRLLQGQMSEAEYYSYSLGMLAFGILLLIVGVAIRNLGARMLSLAFVVAATIKVFLFDASALEGLWRVLSFFGMGLAFLAISWFYARYVFGFGRKPKPEAAADPA